ncbi:hypothetical protein ALI144C_34855 [Actinosynnema sp. ALI-1.44]|uniref:DoxX family protein n=1 Tax=Actinosynnema sp. ALI-1.44 TaxID=1933779 RepID=UPI00097C63EC|nr:hypothetical protein [Actinosynnema sp. ALI-1.44]ONI77248.1 hypothetical protein ALI144C_34855 [Actinosynnema sp. ALI-1.44]
MTESRRAILLAVMLGGMGTLHFLVPKPFDRLIPRQLPGNARTWTYASGVGELGTALLVAVPRTRRLGGLLAALLFVAVFPGNVKMALDAKTPSARVAAYGRLPFQWPLVKWALRVRDRAN